MTDEVSKGVAEIIAEQALVDESEIKDETTMEDLGLDSLALVEVVFAIEEKFDISVPYNANDPSDSEFDLTNFKSVVEAVNQLIAEKAKA
jgi:acyl carrier protein